ncbi:MAG: MBL fold metallo-hydrolase [Thermodesulfobacteriota bacterium]
MPGIKTDSSRPGGLFRRPTGAAIKFCVLSSGSKGNALWVEAGGRAVLVDCGLTLKELRRRLRSTGLDPARLEAIVVSHEHRDHISGVGVTARRLRLPVHINQGTLKRVPETAGRFRTEIFETGKEFSTAGLVLRPFSLSHDTADPVGFTFEQDGVKLGLATDLGVSTNLVRERLGGCQALILEANHDYDMLMTGPYPWPLKQRVNSRRGHLSNKDSAELLAAVEHPGLKTVVLAHLSEVNNHPDLVLDFFRSSFKPGPDGFTLTTASQYEPGRLIKV